MDNEASNEVAEWRSTLETSLRAEYSWLALAGLSWLQQGENTFGSHPDNLVQLPAGPAFAGVFMLDGTTVTVRMNEGIPAHSGEGQAVPERPLKPDITGEPDLIYIESMRLMLIERNGELAIRLWDSQSPRRLNFTGRIWYEENDAYRLTAEIIPYDPPKQVMIPNVLGYDMPSEMQAQLKMNLKGEEFSLDAELLDSGQYYLIFKDGTAGNGTYPSGRFLYSEEAKGDQVVVDFNKAYNPPCAFTEYATCPLPTKENSLPISIPAGEKYPPLEHA